MDLYKEKQKWQRITGGLAQCGESVVEKVSRTEKRIQSDNVVEKVTVTKKALLYENRNQKSWK